MHRTPFDVRFRSLNYAIADTCTMIPLLFMIYGILHRQSDDFILQACHGKIMVKSKSTGSFLFVLFLTCLPRYKGKKIYTKLKGVNVVQWIAILGPCPSFQDEAWKKFPPPQGFAETLFTLNFINLL